MNRIGIILYLFLLLPLVSQASEPGGAPLHWAFQPPRPQPVPQVKNSSWVRNPIDAFILASLEKQQIEPSKDADGPALLRRASLDLTGLPPTLAELERFLSDRGPGAFERAVDRLLASPQYGERWARHWLDLARYAESEGFKSDETRPNAWRYRDYVIEAFNSDTPYDRFVQEQIAGDELWPGNAPALVATGFNRHYADESNARNLMQRRQEILNDVTDTVGSVFLGLTFGCARCHDHKFDPITQADYYKLQAFFANSTADDHMILESRERNADYQKKLALWEEKTAGIRKEMAELEKPGRDAIIRDYVEKYPEPIQEALRKPASDRSPFEAQMVAKANLYLSPESHQYIAPTPAIIARLKGADRARWEDLNRQLKSFEPIHPGKLTVGMGFHDISPNAPETHLLRRGAFDAPRAEVEPGFPSVLSASKPRIVPREHSTGRRAALAQWLTDPSNPLTARVIVNRVWHYHFGKGLVATPSDFGTKGDSPSHPPLLDWLAREFVRNGWSLKQLHRLIVTSHTYRQSSAERPQAASLDSENKLLWRFPRQRMEGEAIRDASLSVAGLLNPAMGGPSIFPELPPGMESRGGWPVSKRAIDRNRRSIYVFVRRNTRYPLFESFDMPDTHESCGRRNLTTSPLQALTLLNSGPSLEWARAFATRTAELAGNLPQAQIETAFRLALSRAPTPDELHLSENFFREHQAILEEQSPNRGIVPTEAVPKIDRLAAATLVDFCQMLLNSNEFIYRN